MRKLHIVDFNTPHGPFVHCGRPDAARTANLDEVRPEQIRDGEVCSACTAVVVARQDGRKHLARQVWDGSNKAITFCGACVPHREADPPDVVLDARTRAGDYCVKCWRHSTS